MTLNEMYLSDYHLSASTHTILYYLNECYIIFPLYQAFFTEEYTQHHQEDREKLVRLKDLIAWQVLNTYSQIHVHNIYSHYFYMCVCVCFSADTMAFLFPDPIIRWRNLPPWEESDRGLASFPWAHGGVFQTAEKESGEGVRSERVGKLKEKCRKILTFLLKYDASVIQNIFFSAKLDMELLW